MAKIRVAVNGDSRARGSITECTGFYRTHKLNSRCQAKIRLSLIDL